MAEKCELTVAYSLGEGLKNHEDVLFHIKYLPPYRQIKPSESFVIQKANIRKLTKRYDVVIAYGDISWLKYSTLPWFNKQKVIFWTLGVSASYDSGYDKKTTWDKVRAFFYKQADALAFYTTYPIDKYELMGIPRSRMFEAPNTVAVEPIQEDTVKDSILFIGTLYQQKGLQLLLDAYKANMHNPHLLKLFIIGNGPDFDYTVQWIKENGLEERIIMPGAIYDRKEKARYFARALACISPLQAGLSVLESMGYGVPFITTKDAVTGGELFNVHDGIDGIVMNSPEELPRVIGDVFDNRDKYLTFGRNARVFYNECRRPEDMADGLWNAVKYILNK